MILYGEDTFPSQGPKKRIAAEPQEVPPLSSLRSTPPVALPVGSSS